MSNATDKVKEVAGKAKDALKGSDSKSSEKVAPIENKAVDNTPPGTESVIARGVPNRALVLALERGERAASLHVVEHLVKDLLIDD